MVKNFLLVIIVVLFIRCDSKKSYSKINSPQKINLFQKKSPLSEEEEKNWHLKDIITDSLPGISLTQIYDSLLINKKGKEVIIAVLDSEIDIEHKDIKNHVWKNEDEIPHNGIDDDKNGYIDDVNGWNFLGNKKGENASFTSYAYTRILKKYDSLFKDKKKEDIKSKDSLLFFTYLRAKEKYKSRVEYAKEDIEYADMLLESMANVKKILSQYFPYKKYTLEDLDSLKKVSLKNVELQKAILIRSNFMKYGFTQNYMNNYKLSTQERTNKLLNLEYNDREIIGDNSNDIKDINYGNNLVNKNINLFEHGTEVTGSILSVKYKNIKIMPVCISPFGDEHDKDIALAIRYAVNNGAKVINMSFGKEFSLHRKWVFDAFKYAEKNNVLIVSSAGNSRYNLNIKKDYYTNDNLDNGEEVTDNFLLVGGISNKLNNKFLYSSTNYGNIDVDLFAPADDIYTTLPNNKYILDSGTSLASAITSGVAALLYAYYPNLTASQVKHILMDAGLEYTLEVNTPTEEDKNKTTPFNQLSKSGKVLNAYNAFIMADSISRSN
jgi:subtilisin family serine protease